MYIKDEDKDEKLHELLNEKIMICKKDIKCENGTFVKGTFAYADFYSDWDSMKLKLYDLSQLQDCEFNIYSCESDDVTESVIENINVENYNEYFEIHKEATIYLMNIRKEHTDLYDKSFKFDDLSRVCAAIGTICFALLLPFLNVYSSFKVPMFISGVVFILSGVTFGLIKTRKERKADELLCHRMKYLFSVALESEYISNCDDEIKQLRDKLYNLANSALYGDRSKEKVNLLKD